ncbi:hypothetical protein [Actinophytocola sp.]|uniref:hypothetical protein n=1 Tax=Actinophytocola sp. TaxID=1872138 RepID=UPI002D7F53EE|nr:hypothetical protein [Actinophytocola sp.]HET9140632.1 hypothetical protein [Actinophytocola sp.]
MSEPITATMRTERLEQVDAEAPDPLAKITLTPRAFAAVLATLALLVGLLLALLPVRVAGSDPASPASVTCGNTIGGVETDMVAGGLDSPDQPTVVAYVAMCERAIADRVLFSWPMFFLGGLVIIAMGVVRRDPVAGQDEAG